MNSRGGKIMKKALVFLSLIILVVILALSGCSKATSTPAPAPASTSAPAPTPTAAPIEMRFAHFSAPGGVDEINVFRPYLQQIENAANGKLKINIFGGAVLASQPDSFDAAANGLADISWVVTSSIPGRFQLTNLVDLPLMSEAMGEGRGAVAWNMYQKFPEIHKEFEGTHVLYLMDNDSDYVLGSNKPIRTLDDLKGLKARISPGPPTTVMKALGASPMYCASTEIYENMQKGVIDAWAISFSGANTFRLQEITKFVLEGGPNGEFYAGGQCMLMNEKLWESLPPDIQDAFNQFGGVKGAQFINDHYVASSDIAREEFLKAGVTISKLSPEEFTKWSAIAQETWKAIIDDLQSKGLPAQAVFDAVQQYRAKYAK
jgi:TRAP-type C4-dicarboxylate transport system substrate-binding protein